MTDSFDLKMPKFQNGDEMVSYVNRQIEKARAEMAAEFQEKMALTDADIEGPYGETKDAAEARKRAEAAPQPLTFDINWIDPDRSPVMFIGITGSGIDNGLLTLHGDKITHLINMTQVSHVNIWEERDG